MSYKIELWDGAGSSLKAYAELLSENYERHIGVSFLEWKHKLNPVGPSVIAFAYDGEKLVAARAFQRAYSFNKNRLIYQPCDTVTHNDHRQKGLFRELTQLCLNNINLDKTLIINFPNDNSEPAYLKMGWSKYSNLIKEYSFNPFGVRKELTRENILTWCRENKDTIFSDYIRWRFINHPTNNYRFFINDSTILVKKGNQIGTINIDSIPRIKHTVGLSIRYAISRKGFSFRGNKLSFATKSGARVVFNHSSREEVDEIFSYYSPLSLMDTF